MYNKYCHNYVSLSAGIRKQQDNSLSEQKYCTFKVSSIEIVKADITQWKSKWRIQLYTYKMIKLQMKHSEITVFQGALYTQSNESQNATYLCFYVC